MSAPINICICDVDFKVIKVSNITAFKLRVNDSYWYHKIKFIAHL